MITLMNLKQLHEIDDSQWLEETVKLLKNQRFPEETLRRVGKMQAHPTHSVEYCTREAFRQINYLRSRSRPYRYIPGIFGVFVDIQLGF